LVLAVDARTIKVVRERISAADIPVLIRMMGDKDHGVASAAAMMLVTLGKQAMPALKEASLSKNPATATQARSALQLLDDCYKDELRDVMNSDVCPTGRPNGRPQSGRR
jgi:HEAT repeat protein